MAGASHPSCAVAPSREHHAATRSGGLRPHRRPGADHFGTPLRLGPGGSPRSAQSRDEEPDQPPRVVAGVVLRADAEVSHAAHELRFDLTVPANRARLDAVERLAGVADEAGLTMIQLALGFVTAHPAVTCALIGPRTLDHLRSQLAAADTVLSADVLDAIDAIVAPGTDLAAHEKFDTPPALLDPALRRR